MPIRRKLTRSKKRRYAPRRFNEVRACLRRMKYLPTLMELDRLLMKEALERCYTKTEAASVLGLTREGLRKKLYRMGLR